VYVLIEMSLNDRQNLHYTFPLVAKSTSMNNDQPQNKSFVANYSHALFSASTIFNIDALVILSALYSKMYAVYGVHLDCTIQSSCTLRLEPKTRQFSKADKPAR